MSFEIERKFLLRNDGWRKLSKRHVTIRQAYLATGNKSSVRVRIKDEKAATLTVKSRPISLRRLELEYTIPLLEAEAMMQLREGSVIEKIRHIVPWGDLNWEVDVFLGRNAGLVLAEIELRDEHQQFRMPDWIGREITGQSEYYNSSLVTRPYCEWAHADENLQQLA